MTAPTEMHIDEVRKLAEMAKTMTREQVKNLKMPRFVLLECNGEMTYLDTLNEVDASLIKHALSSGKNPSIWDYNRAHMAADKRSRKAEKLRAVNG